jgi:hypothetical protein
MQPGLVLGAYVETLPVEEGIGSAARSILGRGPAQPRLPRSRKALEPIAMTQGAGPEAGPRARPSLLGPWAFGDAKSGPVSEP